MKRICRLCLFPVLFGVLVAVFFLPFLTGKYFPYAADYTGSDLTELNVPFRYLAAQSWHAGNIPLWSQQLAAGFPLLAEGQSGIFYPLNLLLFTTVPLGYAVTLALAFNFFLAGWFTYLLCRQFKISFAGSFLAALAFSLSGFFVFRIKHLNLINGAVWVPLIFYGIERYLAATNWRHKSLWLLGISGAFAVQFFAGHPEISFISVLSAFFYFTVRFWFSGAVVKERHWQRICMYISPWVLMGIVTLGFTAIQLFPTLELASVSSRGSWASYEESVKWFFSPLELLTAVSPFAFGNPADATYRGSTVGLVSGFWEDNLYFGILPLFFACVALLTLWRRRIVAQLGWIIIFAAAFIFALYNPLFPLLWMAIPGLKVFRFFQRFWLIGLLAFTVLSGFGYDVIMERVQKFISQVGLLKRSPLLKKGLPMIIILLVVVDLFSVGLNYIGWMPVTYFDSPESVNFLKTDVSQFRVMSFDWQQSWAQTYFLSGGWLNSSELFMEHRELIQPNLSALFGVATINDRGWDEGGQLDSHLTHILLALKAKSIFDQTTHSIPLPAASSNVLGLANVKYLLSFYPLTGKNITLVKTIKQSFLPPVQIYRNANVLPRAYVVFNVVAASPGTAVPELFSDQFDPTRSIVVEDGRSSSSDPVGNATSTIVSMTDRQTVVKAASDRAGYLFLSQLDYPGWHARVDGVPASIIRANSAFMAVPITAGVHTVSVTYEPMWFMYGKIISLITLVSVLGYCIVLLVIARQQHKKYHDY